MICLRVGKIRLKTYQKRGAASYGNSGSGSNNGGLSDEELDTRLLVPVEEEAGTEAQTLPSRSKSRVSTKGQSWLRKLAVALADRGLTVQSLSHGYKLVGSEQEQEFQFYPNFELSQLPADTNLELGLEILRSKGLQRMLVENTDDKPLTTLKLLWNRWQRGLNKGLYARAGSFTSYVGENGYRVSVEGADTLLTERIPDWDALNQREKAEALLATTEPDLLAKLPGCIKEELADLLEQSELIANSPYVEVAREPLIRRVNQRLGYQLRDLAEFQQVIGLVRQNGSRGAIAETFVRRFLVGGLTGSEQYRKPYFVKEDFGSTQDCQPDMLRPIKSRTLDIKAGYSESNIKDDQLAKYAKLVEASKVGAFPSLQQKLVTLGILTGKLAGHDYLFLPDSKNNVRVAAVRAFIKIQDNGFLAVTNVYYVQSYQDVYGEVQAGIFQLEFDPALDEVVSKFIGNKLPD